MFLNPRKSFTVTVPSPSGADTFLCYSYVQGTDVERDYARRIWSHLGAPVLVIVGSPREGAPVYRPSGDAIRAVPAWSDTVDPGLCVGHLVSSTIEEVKRAQRVEPVEVDIEGQKAVFDELPTWIGDRKTWMMEVRPDAVKAQNECGPMKTHDLDWSDPGTAKTIRMRAARA